MILAIYLLTVVVAYGALWADAYAFQVRLENKYAQVFRRAESAESLREWQVSAVAISLIPLVNIILAVLISKCFYHGLRYRGVNWADFPQERAR